MKRQRVLGVISICLFPLLVYAASDVTGSWRGKMASDGGDIGFHLKNDHAVVGGTMLSRSGKEYPISDGKLDGENISFSVAFEWQGMPVKLLVSGKVAGDEMQLHIAADNGYWATDANVKREGK